MLKLLLCWILDFHQDRVRIIERLRDTRKVTICQRCGRKKVDFVTPGQKLDYLNQLYVKRA